MNIFKTRQVSSMMHSARPTVSPVANVVLFCWILKSTDERTIWAKTMILPTVTGLPEWINFKLLILSVIIMWELKNLIFCKPGTLVAISGHFKVIQNVKWPLKWLCPSMHHGCNMSSKINLAKGIETFCEYFPYKLRSELGRSI